MLSSVRAQLYRLFHGRMFWVFLAVLALPILLSAVLLAVVSGNDVLAALFGTSGDALASAAAPGVSAGISTSSDFARLLGAVSDEGAPFALYGSSFVNGSFVGMLAAAFTGLFAAQELSADKRRGFAKNLLQVRGGRFSYAASHMVAAAVAGALFVLAGIMCTALFFGLAGFSAMPSSFASFALWAVQVWLATPTSSSRCSRCSRRAVRRQVCSWAFCSAVSRWRRAWRLRWALPRRPSGRRGRSRRRRIC